MNEEAFREVPVGSDDYNGLLRLRERVLRTPQGLFLTKKELEADADHRHFGIFKGSGALASAVLTAEGRVRQVAVRPDLQGKGFGRRIMAGVEEAASEKGLTELHLNARETVVPFYEGLGWTAEGPVFEEIGLPHRSMRKTLTYVPPTP